MVLLMALQILNLSIDTQNFQPPEPKNTLIYFNQMNSVVELVTEKLITKRDTFPENKNQNKNNSQAHKHTSISIFFPAEQFAQKINTSNPLSYTCFLPSTYSFIYTKTHLQPPKGC
jgi:hypothetical protein